MYWGRCKLPASPSVRPDISHLWNYLTVLSDMPDCLPTLQSAGSTPVWSVSVRYNHRITKPKMGRHLLY